jgi:hypothetical protein
VLSPVRSVVVPARSSRSCSRNSCESRPELHCEGAG